MKLIELLVKELPQMGGWPKWAARCALYPLNPKFIFFDDEGNSRAGSEHPNVVIRNPLYSNFDKVVITMKEYESALAASEGWIEWGGGECPPVTRGTMVDVKLRDGSVFFNKQCWGRGCSKIPGFKVDTTSEAGGAFWRSESSQRDIIAYRLHKPDINSRANDDRLEQDLNECIGQDVDMPEWSGDGVPPVGIECEIYNRSEWFAVKIKFIGDRWIVAEPLDGGSEECFENQFHGEDCYSIADKPHAFRPLRTEAEKAREKAIAELVSVICGDVPDTGMATAAMYAERVYDAGYRKEDK